MTGVVTGRRGALSRVVAIACTGLVALLTSCSSAASSPHASSSSAVAPNVLLGIAAAEKACMSLADALTKQQAGGSITDITTAMTAASGSARAAAEQDARWSAFANDIGSIANGEATPAATTRVGGVCAQLSTDASVYTTADPYASG